MITSEISALKSRIISMYSALRANFNAHNAKILNTATKELFEITGEVYANGQFVKPE